MPCSYRVVQDRLVAASRISASDAHGKGMENLYPFSHQEKVWAAKMMTDIMRVGNFGRGEYVFHHHGFKDAFNNYCWVVKRCWNLGFVCPSEARWWIISKVKRFFWKKSLKK